MTRSRTVVSAAAVIVAVGAAVALGAFFLGSAKAAVGPLPGEALLLPADAKFVGGIDVKRFVQSAFYVKYAGPQARNRPETFKELEEKTGLNPERDIDQVVFAGTPPAAKGTRGETGMVVALGRFDRAKISRVIETEKKDVTSKSVQGVPVYLFGEGRRGSGALAFLDDHTLVMGSQTAVEAAIASQSQGGKTLKQNAALMALLERVRPDATFWAVGDQSVFENMPKNVPGPGGQITLPGLRSLSVAGDVDPMVAIEITGEANDEAAAKNLADVVRGFVALFSLQANQKPELRELASAISVTTDAKQVHVNARVSYELLDALQPAEKRRGQGAEDPAK